MALEVAIARSTAMEISEPLRVDIATLESGYEEAVKIATRMAGRSEGILEIGFHNSPGAVVVSGSAHLVQRVIKTAHAEGFLADSFKRSHHLTVLSRTTAGMLP